MKKSREGIIAYARRLRQRGHSDEKLLLFLKKNCENEGMIHDLLTRIDEPDEEETPFQRKTGLRPENRYEAAGWLLCIAGYSLVVMMRKWEWTALILVFLGGWLINREWKKERR